MGKYSITNVNYRLMGEASDHKMCVSMYFLFDKKPTKKLFYFQKRSGFNYVKEAQRIAEKELKNGKLVRFAKKYHKKRFVPSKLVVTSIIAVVAGAIAVGVGGFFTWKYFNTNHNVFPKEGEEVTVTTDVVDPSGQSHTISLTNEEAVVGSNYLTDIKLNANTTTIALPLELDKVTSFNQELTKDQYAYDFINNTTGKLVIPAEYVRGPVSIALTLRDVEVTVAMTVNTITRCSVSYNGQPLVEGSTHESFPTTTTEFVVDSIDPGYVLDNECFSLTYKDGTQVSHSYKETGNRKILTVNAVNDFTFEVAAKVSEDAVMMTAQYNSLCTGIYYLSSQGDYEIKKGESMPVIASSTDEINFGINLESSVTKLYEIEISCSLADAKILLKPSTKYSNIVTVDCSACDKLTDFELNIHPLEYNSISVTTHKGNDECLKIAWNGTAIKFDEQTDVYPEMTSKGVGIVFEVTTTGAKLKEENISIDVEGYTKDITYKIGNVYKLTLYSEDFKPFSLTVSPETPLSSVKVTVNNNDKCTITYKGIPVSGNTVDVTPVFEDGKDVIEFGVSVKDDTEFSSKNVWFNDLFAGKKPTMNVEPANGSSNYKVSISLPHVEEGTAFADFKLFVNPGEKHLPLVTFSYPEAVLKEHFTFSYIDAEGVEQTLEEDTTVKYPLDSTRPMVIGAYITADEGWTIGDNGIDAVPTEETGYIMESSSLKRVLGTRKYYFEIVNGQTSLSQTPDTKVFLRFGYESKNVAVETQFNAAVKNVALYDQTIEQSGQSFSFENLDQTLTFIVETNGVELLYDETYKQVWVEGIEKYKGEIERVEQIGQYKYEVTFKYFNISDCPNFKLCVEPEEYMMIDTFRSGDTDKFTATYYDTTTKQEVEIGTEATRLTYTKGVYEYEYSLDIEDDYRIKENGYTVTARTATADEYNIDATLSNDVITADFTSYSVAFDAGLITSIEINVEIEIPPLTMTLEFNDGFYSVYDSSGTSIVSGVDVLVDINDLTEIVLYIKTEKTMNLSYITINKPNLQTSLEEYGGEEYDYTLTISGINQTTKFLSIKIGEPATLKVDDESFNNVAKFAGGHQSITNTFGVTSLFMNFVPAIEGQDAKKYGCTLNEEESSVHLSWVHLGYNQHITSVTIDIQGISPALPEGALIVFHLTFPVE